MKFCPTLLLASVFASSLACILAASATTGPAFEEMQRLSAVQAATPLVRNIASHGPAVLWSAEGQHVLTRLGTPYTLFSLLGAWSSLSLGRLGLVDLLTAARLPLLVVAALGPVALFALLRDQWGERAAVLSAVALLCTPRFLHGAAITSNAVFLTSVALLVVAFGRAAMQGRRRVCAALLASATLALGAAHTLAVLWIVLALLAAHWLRQLRPGTRRGLRGDTSAPTWLLGGLAAILVGMIALNPALWKVGSVGIAGFALSHISLVTTPTVYAGGLLQAPPLPASYPSVWLLLTTPLPMLIATLVAAPLLWGHGRTRWRRGAAVDLAALAALGLLCAALPNLLLRFTSLLTLALPLIAAAFVWTLTRLEASVSRGGRWVAPALVLLTMVPGILELPTAAAGYGAQGGGSRHVIARRILPAGDGSELARVAPALDALGREKLSVAMPATVPKTYFEWLTDSGRLKTSVDARAPAQPADAVLTQGDLGGAASAIVSRDGAVLWTLRSD